MVFRIALCKIAICYTIHRYRLLKKSLLRTMRNTIHFNGNIGKRNHNNTKTKTRDKEKHNMYYHMLSSYLIVFLIEFLGWDFALNLTSSWSLPNFTVR